jgi:hypothetical protein
MPLSERQKFIANNLREFEEDLAKRKKTMKWKLKNTWLFLKIKIGLI